MKNIQVVFVGKSVHNHQNKNLHVCVGLKIIELTILYEIFIDPVNDIQ